MGRGRAGRTRSSRRSTCARRWTGSGSGRGRGRLGGVLERVRELLDQAVEQERRSLFPDPSDAARLAEAELDQLPGDTARAVRQLADYQWRSPEAAATYQQIRDLLRREVLDTQFRG